MGKRRDEPDEPTLELPSFFRRKRRRADESAADGEAEATSADSPGADAPPAERPAESPAAEADAETPPLDEPAVEHPAEPEPGAAGEPEPEPVAAAEPEPEPSPEPPEPAPTPEPEPAPEPAGDHDDTTVLEPATAPGSSPDDDHARHDPSVPAAAVSEPQDEPVDQTELAPEPSAGGRRAARAARAPRTRPVLPAGAAALVVGAVVGAAGTALTWAALQGCEALRGTDSCGGPGLLVLVAILVLMVVGGALLLKALQVAEAKGTSFLGVGLMTVVVLVALMESLFSAWMFLAIPVLTALCFLAAQWVSTRFVDVEDSPPPVDVR